MTDDACAPDLAVVREEIIEIATSTGVLTLDGACIEAETPSVTLSTVEHVVALLQAGANVLYLDAPPLSLPDAEAWLAARFDPEADPEDTDLHDRDTSGVRGDAREAALRADLLRHLGTVPLLHAGVLYGGILHVLTLSTDWFRDLEDRAEQVVLDRVGAANAILDRLDRARQHALEVFDAWFHALPDRLGTDEAWLALTTEPARKQYVRRLAESELAIELTHVDGTRVKSSVNQGAALAADRRKPIIAARTAAVGDFLPELAARPAATPEFASATKKDRERLAREHISARDPLATAHVHAGRLAELALSISRATGSADTAPGGDPEMGEPALF